jgi:hypothetical protein
MWEMEVRDFFLHSTASRPHVGSTQPPVQWVLGLLSPGIKRPRQSSDHSPPSRVEFKNDGTIPLFPHTSSWRGAQLIKLKITLHFVTSPGTLPLLDEQIDE